MGKNLWRSLLHCHCQVLVLSGHKAGVCDVVVVPAVAVLVVAAAAVAAAAYEPYMYEQERTSDFRCVLV